MKKVTDLKRDEGILCTTEAEAKAICRLMDEAGLRWNTGGSYLESTEFRGSPIYYRPSRGTFSTLPFPHDGKLYPASDFIQEKKIVGYVLKDDKYLEAVKAITGYDFDFTKVWGGKDPQLCYEKLKEANVLDIFMKPVYEEEKPEFKVGDVVVGWHTPNNELARTPWKIRKKLDGQDEIYVYPVEKIGWSTGITDIRHATPEEIKEYNSPKLPKINGYEGKRVGNLVMYGCAEIPIAYFKNHNGNRQVKSMILDSGVEINEENMNQIRKYLSK